MRVRTSKWKRYENAMSAAERMPKPMRAWPKREPFALLRIA